MAARIFTRRRFTVAMVLLMGAAAAGFALRPERVEVDSFSVRRSALRSTIDEDGRTRVRSRFVIAAPVIGRLERITLREGDRVARGDIVAWLSPLPLDSASRRAAKARLDAARGLLDEATARARQATVALDVVRRAESRKKTLLAAGAISAEEYENADADMRAGVHELDASESRVRSARAGVRSRRSPCRDRR